MFRKEVCFNCDLGPCHKGARNCEGLDGNSRVRVMATEMEGAHEKADGRINSRQTYCPALHYNEHLQADKHYTRASKEQRKATAMALGLNPNSSQEKVDAVIEKIFGLKQ